MRRLKRVVCFFRGHIPKYRLNKRSQLIECHCAFCGDEIHYDFKGRLW